MLLTTTSIRTILKNVPSTTHTSHDVWFQVLGLELNKYGVFAVLEAAMYSPVSVPLVTTTYCELATVPMGFAVARVIPNALPDADAYVVLLWGTHSGGGEGGDGGGDGGSGGLSGLGGGGLGGNGLGGSGLGGGGLGGSGLGGSLLGGGGLGGGGLGGASAWRAWTSTTPEPPVPPHPVTVPER